MSVVASRKRKAARLLPKNYDIKTSWTNARKYLQLTDVPSPLLSDYTNMHAYAMKHLNRFIWWLQERKHPLIKECESKRGKLIFFTGYWSHITLHADLLLQYVAESEQNYKSYLCYESIHTEQWLKTKAETRYKTFKRTFYHFRTEAFEVIDFICKQGVKFGQKPIREWKCWSFLYGNHRYSLGSHGILANTPEYHLTNLYKELTYYPFRCCPHSLRLRRINGLLKALRETCLLDPFILIVIRYVNKLLV